MKITSDKRSLKKANIPYYNKEIGSLVLKEWRIIQKNKIFFYIQFSSKQKNM